jgi:hypothetical protein
MRVPEEPVAPACLILWNSSVILKVAGCLYIISAWKGRRQVSIKGKLIETTWYILLLSHLKSL